MIQKYNLEALNLPLMFYKTQVAKFISRDDSDYDNSYHKILDFVMQNGN